MVIPPTRDYITSAKLKKGGIYLAKKPKKEWQIAVRAKLDGMGIGYLELADRIGEKEGCVRQVMCKDNQPFLRDKICRYLDIELGDD